MHSRDPTGTVIHSDRGTQFWSENFVRALRDAWLFVSTGRVGACVDIAAIGIVLHLAAEERFQSEATVHPERASFGDHHMDEAT